MFKNLISYDVLYEACDEMFAFGRVTMLRDFGPLKMGEKIDSIWFNLNTSTVQVFEDINEEPKLKQEFKFQLEAI